MMFGNTRQHRSGHEQGVFQASGWPASRGSNWAPSGGSGRASSRENFPSLTPTMASRCMGNHLVRVPLRAFAAPLLAFTLALLLTFALFTPLAWAEGESEDGGGNLVDTGQLPDSSFIYSTSIYDLQVSDIYYEGQTVQITGEVVGDRINDETEPGHCWITVNALPDEQAASIQVYVTEDQASQIDTFGRYQVTGSTVSVMGSFHLACGQHDGLTDLHATSLTVSRPGQSEVAEFSPRDFIPAATLATLGLALFIIYRRRREDLR